MSLSGLWVAIAINSFIVRNVGDWDRINLPNSLSGTIVVNNKSGETPWSNRIFPNMSSQMAAMNASVFDTEKACRSYVAAIDTKNDNARVLCLSIDKLIPALTSSIRPSHHVNNSVNQQK